EHHDEHVARRDADLPVGIAQEPQLEHEDQQREHEEEEAEQQREGQRKEHRRDYSLGHSSRRVGERHTTARGRWYHTGALERRSAMSTPASASSARNEVRGVVPKLVELSEKVLYADVWERAGLSKRDRSLITVAALTALYRSDQLKGHIERALANGVTRDEISEVITHMA